MRQGLPGEAARSDICAHMLPLSWSCIDGLCLKTIQSCGLDRIDFLNKDRAGVPEYSVTVTKAIDTISGLYRWRLLYYLIQHVAVINRCVAVLEDLLQAVLWDAATLQIDAWLLQFLPGSLCDLTQSHYDLLNFALVVLVQ